MGEKALRRDSTGREDRARKGNDPILTLVTSTQDSELGACAGCDGYRMEHAHDFLGGEIAIHCGVVHGMVHPRMDIGSHVECSPEVLIKVI